ncbi:MAG: type II secretion system F family protein [Planctomycetaceae bacterium]|jgi:type IV pilus assembly protein PilC|nr:type II secretion system F family protein [Planctomycetaceae bacterium]
MPQFKFEAIDQKGNEINDIIEAATEDDALATIRHMRYQVTKISIYKERKAKTGKSGAAGKTRTFGGVRSKQLAIFTRQLSILQDAGLPILRSLNILMQQAKPGPLRNALIDVTTEIESGSSLSESMAKAPKAFNRLFVNMIKAGEAGGALETILQRLAEFLERSEALKSRVKSALTYPICVVTFAVGILGFIMYFIVPSFEKIFTEFGLKLPPMTMLLITISQFVVNFFYLIPLIPFSIWLMVKLTTGFDYGRFGWHLFLLKLPVFGALIEKTTVARTTRTLGTLVTSGVPILEALHITKETSNNAVFELMYQRILEAIRDGDTISNPMKMYSKPPFHFGALAFSAFFMPVVGALVYLTRLNARILDDMVVNMVDVGEETGELDTMLYKIADTYDQEVEAATNALMSIIEPLLVMFLGGMVGFIVIALFLPLISLITNLSGSNSGS